MSDVFAEAEGLKRRRALLEALTAQSQSAPIQGNTGLGQAALKVLSGIMAQRQGTQLDAAQEANRTRYNVGLGDAVSKYMDSTAGKPGGTMSTAQAGDLMNNDQAPPPMAEPVAADPRRAVAEAMASRYPEMQQVGGAGLKELLADIKAKRAAPGYKEHVVDGSLVRSYDDGRVQNMGNYKATDVWEPAPDQVIDGKTIKFQRNKTTGELKSLASGGQTISVNNSPENKGEAAAYTTTIEQISPKGKSYEGAQAADANLRATTEALGAMKNGADMGAGADVAQVLRKLGERVGIPNAATTPTDQLSSVLKERVFHKLGGLGVAISDADRRFMETAAGDLSRDPVAMKRMLALDAAASMKELIRHNTRVQDLASHGGAYSLMANNTFPLNFHAPDDEFAAMVDNVLQGKPTTSGMPAAATTPQAAAPARGGSAPMSKWGTPVPVKGF